MATRQLNPEAYDTMLHTEYSDPYFRCSEIDVIRPMRCKGCEKKQGMLKWECLAVAFDLDCASQLQCRRLGKMSADARSRVVRTRVEVNNLRQRPALPPSTLQSIDTGQPIIRK